MKYLLCLLAFLVLSGVTFAQDQIEVMDDPPAVFDQIFGGASDADLINKAELREENAEKLIETVLREVSNNPGATVDDKTYYMIHILSYKKGEVVTDHQNWYVFHKSWTQKSGFSRLSDFRLGKHFTDLRIFGSSKIAIIYLHANVDSASVADIDAAIANFKANFGQVGVAGLPGAIASASATTIKQDILDGKQVKIGVNDIDVVLSSKKEFRSVGKSGLIENQFLPVTYRIAVKKKQPDPQQSLKGIAKIVFPANGALPAAIEITTKKHFIGTVKTLNLTPMPADITVTAYVGSGDSPKQLGQQTYDNEGRYRYNFSFALPLKSYEDFKFDFTNQIISAKKVDKQSLFAMVNFSPIPIDTKKPQFQLVPTFLYGVPITSKPLHQHLVGVSFGFNYFQPFVGVHFNRLRELRPGITGPNTLLDPNNFQIKWVRKLSYGINLPVSTVTNLLKK